MAQQRFVQVVRGLVAAAALSGLIAPPTFAGAPRNRTAPDPAIEIPGELIVVSLTTDATVEVNGKVIGQIPVEPYALRPGRHTVRVTKRGFAPVTQDFEVAPGATVELEIDLLPVAGLLSIVSTPSGASVKVDGKVLGVTPLDTDVPAGTRLFSVTLPGYTEDTRQVEVAAAVPLTLNFKLNPLPVASGPAFYETWWFWTLVGVAGAGTAAAVIATSGGEVTPQPDLELRVP
jgi:hypothetical protein